MNAKNCNLFLARARCKGLMKVQLVSYPMYTRYLHGIWSLIHLFSYTRTASLPLSIKHVMLSYPMLRSEPRSLHRGIHTLRSSTDFLHNRRALARKDLKDRLKLKHSNHDLLLPPRQLFHDVLYMLLLPGLTLLLWRWNPVLHRRSISSNIC